MVLAFTHGNKFIAKLFILIKITKGKKT